MRHGNGLRKFTMTSAHRQAMFRNMVTSLIVNGRLETTVERAKDLRRVVERIITAAKTDNLASRRKAYGYLMNKESVQKLFSDVAPKYKSRAGGYSRIVRTRTRAGDAADLAIIELVDGPSGAAA
jgi:large subunit ribosomal protein L17